MIAFEILTTRTYYFGFYSIVLMILLLISKGWLLYGWFKSSLTFLCSYFCARPLSFRLAIALMIVARISATSFSVVIRVYMPQCLTLQITVLIFEYEN